MSIAVCCNRGVKLSGVSMISLGDQTLPHIGYCILRYVQKCRHRGATLLHDWHHKVSLTYKSSPKHTWSHVKTTNNSVKYEVLVKQYLPAFLDISDHLRTLQYPRNTNLKNKTLIPILVFAYMDKIFLWHFITGMPIDVCQSTNRHTILLLLFSIIMYLGFEPYQRNTC